VPRKHRKENAALFTLTEDDILKVEPLKVSKQVQKQVLEHKLNVMSLSEVGNFSLTAGRRRPRKEILRELIPRAIAAKYEKAIPDNFELSQITISGELSAKPLGIGASGTVTLTYNRRKSKSHPSSKQHTVNGTTQRH